MVMAHRADTGDLDARRVPVVRIMPEGPSVSVFRENVPLRSQRIGVERSASSTRSTNPVGEV
jgi:hypothetical protein